MVREIEEKNNLQIRNSQETLVSEIEFLLDSLDPEKLSFETFDLEGYLDFLLKSIGEKFNMSRIIIRYEDKFDQNKLNVLGTFGFDKNQVKELTFVTKENRMAAYLANIQDCYYASDLSDPITKFDQRTFAEAENLKSSFACALFLDDSFVGFIIYHKTKKDGFAHDEREFLKTLNSIIQKIFVFAEKLSHSSDQFIKLSSNYSSILASLLLSFHDAKEYLMIGSQLIKTTAEIIETAQFVNNEEKGEISDVLKKVLEKNELAVQLVIDALKAERQISQIDNLLEIIKESVTPLRPQLRGIQINLPANGAKPISIIGNSRLLRQVFFNIIYNSYRAIVESTETKTLRGKGIITISLSQDSDYVLISIADNGIGIQKNRLQSIFDARKSTWKKRAGTGIGLGLCKEIIEVIHSGKIDIDSKYLKGTTVRITLKISKPQIYNAKGGSNGSITI